MDGNTYISNLQATLLPYTDPKNAEPMKKYLKGQFDYLGIKSPERNALLSGFIKKNGLPDSSDLDEVIEGLWALPQREYQYCAMTIAQKLLRKVDHSFLKSIEYMVLEKSWWDTVDFVAANLAGKFLLNFPEFVPAKTDAWSDSTNMWLNRTAILYQLKYKAGTNTELLTKYVLPHTGSKEFFIKKAIGWALREYSKTDARWVQDFIKANELQPLSVREGLKWLERKSQQ
jgi:3-methyladenine DNA glycosylase AlkD